VDRPLARPIVPVLALLAAVGLAAQAPSPEARPAYSLQTIAPGVHVAVPTRPAGMLVESNNTFIVGKDGVIVVDTGFSPTLTRSALALLRTVTDTPVRTVVNTHWHDDHFLGNVVYADAFPKAAFVAHRRFADYVPTTAEANRKGMLRDAGPFFADLRSALAKGQTLQGQPLTEAGRASAEADLAQWAPYERETPTVRIVLPTTPVADALRLKQGRRIVEVRHLGRGHTAGDLIVWLPAERIAITGDLVIAPVPLIGADQSYVADWATTLDALLALKPAVIVPGHGAVQRDTAYVERSRDLLRTIAVQATAAIAQGLTLDAAQQRLDLGPARAAFAGTDPALQRQFDNFVARSGVAAVYREGSVKTTVVP
jgi:glyoxylase-like metal-dependent hydrolase (beta-lactamase superfamily II)